MNLVGKILTVLIFVMSLVFMSFAVAVYATHKNWKDVVMRPETGLKYKLANLKSRNQELKDQQSTLESQLAEEKKAGVQAEAKLESEKQLLSERLAEAKRKEAGLIEETRKAVMAMNDAHDTLADLRDDVKTLRADILKAQRARDASVKELVRLTDDLHQKVNQLKALEELRSKLEVDLAKAEGVLRHHGLNKEEDPFSTPPIVDGLVLAVPSRDLVEISIGGDDGLRIGHKLHVFRVSGGASVYVGLIQVVRTHPDRSVCEIDPKYLKSPMQRGDRVTSRLNSSR